MAFVSADRSGNSWRPCRRPAKSKNAFCRAHELIIGGVLLGICVNEYPDGVQHRREQALADMPVAGKVPS